MSEVGRSALLAVGLFLGVFTLVSWAIGGPDALDLLRPSTARDVGERLANEAEDVEPTAAHRVEMRVDRDAPWLEWRWRWDQQNGTRGDTGVEVVIMNRTGAEIVRLADPRDVRIEHPATGGHIHVRTHWDGVRLTGMTGRNASLDGCAGASVHRLEDGTEVEMALLENTTVVRPGEVLSHLVTGDEGCEVSSFEQVVSLAGPEPGRVDLRD